MKIPRLLAPVRDQVSLQAALNAGADAVYFGIGELNMRISSKGIDLEELTKTVAKAHAQNVQVFVVLNAIIYEHELPRLDEILAQVKKSNADAVIAHDLAVIARCQNLQIPFHVSTQANISNSGAARFWEKMGAQCIVLARECTLEQIADIRQKVNCQIEVFCHGAMCVSVSGRCYMSQFTDCKSANRGECVQPCRREYLITDKETGAQLEVGNGFVMSPRDMCTLQILEKVVASGIDVLKIEGRGRAPEYIATVVRAYRTALDLIEQNEYSQSAKDELLEQIKKVYNRGFSTGFFLGRPAEEGWSRGAHSRAEEKKEYIGKVTNFFKKTKICEMVPHKKDLHLQKGDEIWIQGTTTGVRRLKLEEVKNHPAGELTFPSEVEIRKNDEIYRILPASENS